jgi:DNA (cytosine-5)-methyltransferase 1
MSLEYTTLDLFAGCGGLTQGFTSVSDTAGRFVPVAAVERDKHAAATYAANFGAHVYASGIEDWIGTEIPKVDIVIGGPPCQGFSALGTRDPADPRNKMWAFYAGAVQAAEPSYFVLENVAPFLKSEQFRELEAATEPGGLLGGYVLQVESVLASDFGAAQKRRRAIVIGRRDHLPAVDLPSVASAATRTVKDAIGVLATKPLGSALPPRETTIDVANLSLDVPGIFETHELHVSRFYTDLSLERFRHIPPGGNRFDLPFDLQAPCWQKHTTGSGDVMGRLHWDRPSVTIRTEFWKPEKGRYLHPTADRAITHMEAALLQGFPEDYRWCGTRASIGRQIGNAVPVELGRSVARALLAALGAAAAERNAR